MTTKPKAKKFRVRRSSAALAHAAPPAPAEDTAQAATSRTESTRTEDQRGFQGEARGAEGGAQAPAAGATPGGRVNHLRAVMPGGAGSVPRPDATEASGTAEPPATEARGPDQGTASAAQGAASQPDAPSGNGAEDLDSIKAEGLTGRQLRLARRVAQKHDLPATSDFDAVRLLRARGIDPFKRTNMLELVVPQSQGNTEGAVPAPAAKTAPSTLPVPEAKQANLPSTENLSPMERRARDIRLIQRDIARRRRRKMALLTARLGAFVLIPSIVAGYYYYEVATPMYATESEFLVLKADSTGGSGFGGLLSGTQFATSQDSIAVQAFLQSREAMLRLNDEAGFKAHFSQDWIDPIQRLPADASNDDAFGIYSRNVKIGYDPTEGVVRLEVSAADPEVAAEFSRKLISYAQEKVNHLSEQKREDQVGDALKALDIAEEQRREAQRELVRLQQQGTVLDPEGVIASLRSQINTFEMQLQQKQLELAALEDNQRPNQAKVEGVRADVTRLEALISRLNERMLDANAGENSLAALSVQIQMAQADLATRDMMLQSALQQVETTRMEANRQVRYLTTAVEPVPSDSPAYPRKFENTLLAFLVFAGIYLMCALTASILREQVSS